MQLGAHAQLSKLANGEKMSWSIEKRELLVPPLEELARGEHLCVRLYDACWFLVGFASSFLIFARLRDSVPSAARGSPRGISVDVT